MTTAKCLLNNLGSCVGSVFRSPLDGEPWSDTVTIDNSAVLVVSVTRYNGVWTLNGTGNSPEGGFSDDDLNGKTVLTCCVNITGLGGFLIIEINEINVPMSWITSVSVTSDNGLDDCLSTSIYDYDGNKSGSTIFTFLLYEEINMLDYWTTAGTHVIEFTGVE